MRALVLPGAILIGALCVLPVVNRAPNDEASVPPVWEVAARDAEGGKLERFFSFRTPRTDQGPGYLYRILPRSGVDLPVAMVAEPGLVQTSAETLQERKLETDSDYLGRLLGFAPADNAGRSRFTVMVHFEGCTREAVPVASLVASIRRSNINFKENERYYVIQQSISATRVTVTFGRRGTINKKLRAQIDELVDAGRLRRTDGEALIVSRDFEVPYRLFYKSLRVISSGPLSSGEQAITLMSDAGGAIRSSGTMGPVGVSGRPGATGATGVDSIGPAFPWPPPKASASRVLPSELFKGSTTLGEMDARLARALDACGYVTRGYFEVPGGFALATQLEQMHSDGTSFDPPERWSSEVAEPKRFSVSAYLRALLRATPGYYRVVVFVVTAQPFPQSSTSVDRDAAMEWPHSGVNQLPAAIKKRPVEANCVCTVLIYEFQQPTRGNHAVVKIPGMLGIDAHLEKSRILARLQER